MALGVGCLTHPALAPAKVNCMRADGSCSSATIATPELARQNKSSASAWFDSCFLRTQRHHRGDLGQFKLVVCGMTAAVLAHRLMSAANDNSGSLWAHSAADAEGKKS